MVALLLKRYVFGANWQQIGLLMISKIQMSEDITVHPWYTYMSALRVVPLQPVCLLLKEPENLALIPSQKLPVILRAASKLDWLLLKSTQSLCFRIDLMSRGLVHRLLYAMTRTQSLSC